jgi:predicted PurR-regulated permease PerM
VVDVDERLPGQRVLVPLASVVLVLLALRLIPLPLEHAFVVLFTAVLLAAAVTPAADALQRFRVPRGVTVLAVYVIGLAVLVGVVALIVPLVSDEVHALRGRLPRYNEELRGLVERVAGPEQAERFSNEHLIDTAFDQISAYAGRATGFAVSLSALAVRLIIVLVMGYFMAVEADFAERVVTRFTPPPYRARAHRVLSRIGNRLGQWARAQLFLALYFGILFGVGLRLAGVPYAVTIGVIGAVIEIVPYLGGFTTLVLALLVAATKTPLLMVWVLVWYTVVVQTQAHIFAPVLMGHAVGMHPLVVVLALFMGVETLGIFGALLAVPIAVVLQVLLDEFYTFDEPEPLPPPPPDSAASAHIGDASAVHPAHRPRE